MTGEEARERNEGSIQLAHTDSARLWLTFTVSYFRNLWSNRGVIVEARSANKDNAP